MLLDWLQHRELAESEMTAFETEQVESCRSLGWIQRVFPPRLARSNPAGMCPKTRAASFRYIKPALRQTALLKS